MSGYATKTADALRLRSRRALSSWLYQDINHKYDLANVQDKKARNTGLEKGFNVMS
jgi:hypothetical protein